MLEERGDLALEHLRAIRYDIGDLKTSIGAPRFSRSAIRQHISAGRPDW